MTGAVSSQGLVFLAKKVSGEIPLDVTKDIWNMAVPIEVPLFSQVMARPRIYDSSIKKVTVRAIHNSKDIAFLIEWKDETRSSLLDLDKFSDALALEFPSFPGKVKPNFAMGDRENPVNIWYWKAAWQTSEKLNQKKHASTEVKGYMPGFSTAENRLFVDDFLPGVLAGNPVSRPLRPPVENLVAQGFGSTTDMERSNNQNIEGMGSWELSKWTVLVKRTLISKDKYDASFREGTVIPVSFAVWNGSEGNTGARKVVSTWYYVGIQAKEKGTSYIYPVIAFAAALLIEGGIIHWIRKRRA
jgi:hypothetical protein